MPPRRRTDPAAGRAALEQWLADPEGGDHTTIGLAVRWTLDELMVRHPGNAVEVRVPPYGAVQCLPGPRHTRGTPGSTVETDAPTWLALCTGTATWADAIATGRVRAGGSHGDLSGVLPLQADATAH